MVANSAFSAKYGAMCTVVIIVHIVPNVAESAVWPLVTIEILYIMHIVPCDVFEANFGTFDQNRATTTLCAKVGRMCFMPLFLFMLILAYCHPNSNLNPNVNLNGR
jgi:hypothetical protein